MSSLGQILTKLDIIGIRITAFTKQVKFSEELVKRLTQQLNNVVTFVNVSEKPIAGKAPDPDKAIFFGFEDQDTGIKLTFNQQTIDLEVNNHHRFDPEYLKETGVLMSHKLIELLKLLNLSTNRIAFAPRFGYVVDDNEWMSFLNAHLNSKRFRDTELGNANFSLTYQLEENLGDLLAVVNYHVTVSSGKRTVSVGSYIEERKSFIFDFDINTPFRQPPFNIEDIENFYKEIPIKTNEYLRFILSE